MVFIYHLPHLWGPAIREASIIAATVGIWNLAVVVNGANRMPRLVRPWVVCIAWGITCMRRNPIPLQQDLISIKSFW